MIWTIYEYHPLSLWAMVKLIERNMLSQRARFERFAADMLFHIAGGEKIDTERSDRFAKHVDEVYKNPFEGRVKDTKNMTAAEIKDYILMRIRELRGNSNGSDDACREDNP